MAYQKREQLLTEREINKEELEETYTEFLSLFKERDHNKAYAQWHAFAGNSKKMQNLQTRNLLEMNQSLKNRFCEKKVRIEIPIDQLKNAEGLIRCKGLVGTYEVACAAACGHWNKLIPTSQEKQTGTLNLLDHLSELVPPKKNKSSEEKQIGLFTFQNGINNTWTHFIDMGNSILKTIPEKPLCIGLYNPTKGVIQDLLGVSDKLSGVLSDSICSTLQIFTQIAKKLEAINDELLWVHIGHSEGGLIMQTVLTLLQNKNNLEKEERKRIRNYFRTHLIALSYGAVLPIRDEYALATNTYSTQDIATWPRVQGFLESEAQTKKYKIHEITPQKESSQMSFTDVFYIGTKMIFPALWLEDFAKKVWYYLNGGDHGFQGHTYQRALQQDIQNLRNDMEIYGTQAN